MQLMGLFLKALYSIYYLFGCIAQPFGAVLIVMDAHFGEGGPQRCADWHGNDVSVALHR
jgi:hypothetical protein